MRVMDDERAALIMGAVIGGGGSALVLVCGVIWAFPWQVMLFFVAFMVVLGGLLAAMSLAGVRREEQRRASPLFRGELLAAGHRDGVEVGIACSTDNSCEVGTTWHIPVLVRLSEERSPARLRRREIRRLGVPQGVGSAAVGGRVLCVRYEGRPDDFVALNARVDAAVRLAASL